MDQKSGAGGQIRIEMMSISLSNKKPRCAHLICTPDFELLNMGDR